VADDQSSRLASIIKVGRLGTEGRASRLNLALTQLTVRCAPVALWLGSTPAVANTVLHVEFGLAMLYRIVVVEHWLCTNPVAWIQSLGNLSLSQVGHAERIPLLGNDGRLNDAQPCEHQKMKMSHIYLMARCVKGCLYRTGLGVLGTVLALGRLFVLDQCRRFCVALVEEKGL